MTEITEFTLHFRAVHNEVTYRSIENFIPKTKIQQLYKDDIMKSASFSQAGSFFPDWYVKSHRVMFLKLTILFVKGGTIA